MTSEGYGLQLELMEMQCDDPLKNQRLSLPDVYRSLDKDQSLSGSTFTCEQTSSVKAD